MDPVVTPSAIAVKVAPSIIRIVGGQLAGRLTPDQEARLRKAIAAVVVEASGAARPKFRKHPIKRLQWNRDRRRVTNAIENATAPSADVKSSNQGDPAMGAIGSWQEEMKNTFAEAATQGLVGNAWEAWSKILGGRQPDEWAGVVQRGLEWRMAADKDLRHVLRRFDQGDAQGTRELSAMATLAYLDAIPIALGLCCAIFLALAAIAVILAVN